MIKVQIVAGIFFTILCSLHMYQLLTEGGYKGAKIYVTATTQSIAMQTILVVGLIVYTIYLIRLNSKTPEFTKCPKCKESYNYSDTINGKCPKCDVDTIEIEEYYKRFKIKTNRK